MKRERPSEEQIAAKVVEWLRGFKWDVYQEVQVGSYGRVADIVATQGALVWVVECKVSFGLAVIEQAWNWRRTAHYVSIATENPARGGVLTRVSAGSFTHELLARWGIGWLCVSSSVNDDDQGRYGLQAVHEVVPNVLCRPHFERWDSPWKKFLRDEHKTFARAGTNSGRRYTPFQSTCDQLRRLVEAEPGIPLRRSLERIDHHYQTSATARSALAKWIMQGDVKGVRWERGAKGMLLFPTPRNERSE